jgi:hypothetical protein
MTTAQSFRRELLPILQALIDYSQLLEQQIDDSAVQSSTKQELAMQSMHKIIMILQSSRHEYPEWVFNRGFNRFLRGGFRFILIHLDRILEAFFSINYYMKQPIDKILMGEVAANLQKTMAKNAALLQIIHNFFAGKMLGDIHEDFITDITELRNVMRAELPDSAELLDISTDYINLAALTRDVIDIRELLLKILASLPLDEYAVAAS